MCVKAAPIVLGLSVLIFWSFLIQSSGAQELWLPRAPGWCLLLKQSFPVQGPAQELCSQCPGRGMSSLGLCGMGWHGTGSRGRELPPGTGSQGPTPQHLGVLKGSHGVARPGARTPSVQELQGGIPGELCAVFTWKSCQVIPSLPSLLFHSSKKKPMHPNPSFSHFTG